MQDFPDLYHIFCVDGVCIAIRDCHASDIGHWLAMTSKFDKRSFTIKPQKNPRLQGSRG